VGIGVEEAELVGDEAEKVEELLLLRLVPAEAREAAGNAGKQRRWSAGMASPESSREELRGDGTLSRRFPRVYSVA
jgi:hypothetical protein